MFGPSVSFANCQIRRSFQIWIAFERVYTLPLSDAFSRRNCHECTSFDNPFGEVFYGHNFKKKPYHESTNGSTRTIMVCSHFGGFSIWVLFFGYVFCIIKCFRTLVKLCLRAVNEAIIEWSYFMTPEIEITQRLNWLKRCSFQFTQFSFYFSFDWKMPFDFHLFLLENATIYFAHGIIARLQEVTRDLNGKRQASACRKSKKIILF